MISVNGEKEGGKKRKRNEKRGKRLIHNINGNEELCEVMKNADTKDLSFNTKFYNNLFLNA